MGMFFPTTQSSHICTIIAKTNFRKFQKTPTFNVILVQLLSSVKIMSESDRELNSSLTDNDTSHITTTEEIIVGSVYLFISIVYCVPYILTMFLIATDKKMMRMPYYHVVVHMGITDIVQLVFNGAASGIFTLLGGNEHFWVNKGIGGLMNFCWVIYCFLAHVLAFNRFVNIFWPLKIHVIFSMKNTKILIALIWFYGFCWLAAYMSPDFNLLYFVDGYNWDYDFNEISRIAWLVELISDSFHGVCMVIWYACIFIKLKIKVQLLTRCIDECSKFNKIYCISS